MSLIAELKAAEAKLKSMRDKLDFYDGFWDKDSPYKDGYKKGDPIWIATLVWSTEKSEFLVNFAGGGTPSMERVLKTVDWIKSLNL